MAQYNKPRKERQNKENITQIKINSGILVKLISDRIIGDDFADGERKGKEEKIKKPNVRFVLEIIP